MRALMCYKIALLSECLIKHKHTGVHHYVCIDVLSEWSYDWIPYYTHHKYKGVHHYVCVDVL